MVLEERDWNAVEQVQINVGYNQIVKYAVHKRADESSKHIGCRCKLSKRKRYPQYDDRLCGVRARTTHRASSIATTNSGIAAQTLDLF